MRQRNNNTKVCMGCLCALFSLLVPASLLSKATNLQAWTKGWGSAQEAVSKAALPVDSTREVEKGGRLSVVSLSHSTHSHICQGWIRRSQSNFWRRQEEERKEEKAKSGFAHFTMGHAVC